MAKTLPAGDDNHTHDFQSIHNQHVTSMDGTSPHVHVVPPAPANRTLMSNGHSHELPVQETQDLKNSQDPQ